MTFVWKNLLKVAKELIEGSAEGIEPESYYRSSINRSYYGAHKTVVDWLEMKTAYVAPSVKVHDDVIKQIGSINDKAARRVRRKLSLLRSKRVDADYNYAPPSPINKAEAESSLAFAEEICEQLIKIK